MNKKEIERRARELLITGGPWEVAIWNMAMNGITDFKQKKAVSHFIDYHNHLCRAYTYKQEYLPLGRNIHEIADEPLAVKQSLVGDLHDGPAYTEESLLERMEFHINRAIANGIREMWSITDTTPDIGLRAFDIALKLKKQYKQKINVKVGCYPVFGLKDPLIDPERFNILENAAPNSDFIVGLPEKDEKETRVGFKRHTSILLDMGFRYKKEVHIHADQTKTAYSNDSFRIIECLEGLLPEKFFWYTEKGTPKLWLVHVISPSMYSPEKFSCLVEKLLKYNIGVIICFRAAISMRQLRCEYAPIFNSIARVLEFIKAGVKMRFGTDNINDIFVPSGKGTILSELDFAWDILRNYASTIMVKIAIGIEPNDSDRAFIAKALYESKKAIEKHAEKIKEIERKKPLFTY